MRIERKIAMRERDRAKRAVIRVRFILRGKVFQFLGTARVLGKNTGRAQRIHAEYKKWGYIEERFKQWTPVVFNNIDVLMWEKTGGFEKPLKEIGGMPMIWGSGVVGHGYSYGVLAELVEEIPLEEARKWRVLANI